MSREIPDYQVTGRGFTDKDRLNWLEENRLVNSQQYGWVPAYHSYAWGLYGNSLRKAIDKKMVETKKGSVA